MALDRRREPAGQSPAACQDAADDRVVDAELAALLLDALFGGASSAVDVAGVTGVRVSQDELADVVEERRDQHLVAILVLEHAGDVVGGALSRHGVQPEALRRRVPHRGALEEVVDLRARSERLDAAGRQDVHSVRDRGDLALARRAGAVRDPEHGDDQRDVRLDRLDDVGHRRLVLADQAEQAVARLGEGREGLEGLESRGEPPAVAFVVARAYVDRRRGGQRALACLFRDCRLHFPAVIREGAAGSLSALRKRVFSFAGVPGRGQRRSG